MSIAEQIENMKPLEVLFNILSFYECPSTCNGFCCKILDIPVDKESRKIISKLNRKCKKIMNTLRVNDYKYTYNDEVVQGDRIIKEKPCPFLYEDRCTIYDDRPGSCKIYPFIIGQQEDVNHPDYPVMMRIASCEMGFNMLLDYSVFNLFVGKKLGEDMNVLLKEQINVMMYSYVLDKQVQGNLIEAEIPSMDLLRSFLYFLHTYENRTLQKEIFTLLLKMGLDKQLTDNLIDKL